ncbi:MAG: D-aminoacyl-tRNA deacylase [Halanaeroarchaeum sp.]
MIGIVVSRADEASVHIGEHLRSLANWEERADGVYRTDGFELREFDGLHLHLDGVAERFDDPDCVVFASRHSGDSGRLLSAHYTGNFGAAEYGGADRDLSTPCPTAHKHVVQSLTAHAPDGWDVAMECTHHGPTEIGAPAMFVELGSSEAEWRDPDGARAVAKSILELGSHTDESARTVVGFGGNHYAPRPTRLIRETDVAVGHVAADWSLEELGNPPTHETLIGEMFRTSGADVAVFEGDHPEVRSVLEDLGHRVVSETWIRATAGRSMELIEAVEESLCSVEAGLRFGAVETTGAAFVVESLPDDLLAECHGIDTAETLRAVESATVAFETVENGNRVEGSSAFVSRTGYDDLVERLVEILERDYDTVRRADDEVVAERDAFDPEAAHEAGVPEGPLFGKLASGQQVEVEGKTISPEQAQKREIRRFAV